MLTIILNYVLIDFGRLVTEFIEYFKDYEESMLSFRNENMETKLFHKTSNASS